MSYNSIQSEAVPMHRVTAENSTGRLIYARDMGEISHARFILLIGTREGLLQGTLAGLEHGPDWTTLSDKCNYLAVKQELAEIHSILAGVR